VTSTSSFLPSEIPWGEPAGAVAAALRTDPIQGLTGSEALRRLAVYGLNQLRARSPRSIWKVLLAQFTSLLVGLLLVGTGLAFLAREWEEGAAILVVVLANGAIGFVMEFRAARAMEALRALGVARTTVLRDGQVARIPAESLVPGDVVLVEGGDVVTADLRLLEASKLLASEAALTGESLPVAKHSAAIPVGRPLAERSNMLYKATALTRGTGRGVVVATGMRTELGQIAELVVEAEEGETPLERRLTGLGRRLVWSALGISLFVIVAGVAKGEDPFLVVETAIALAVAAVPEGLPIIATIALARGMQRMARHDAIVNRMAAMETLGAATMILTDKTGTLTENRLSVRLLVTSEGEARSSPWQGVGERARRLVEAAVLCNDAALTERDAVGDPIDVALLRLGVEAGLHRAALLERWPEVHEEAFDPETRLMGTAHVAGGEIRVAVKGAVEAVLPLCVAAATEAGVHRLEEVGRGAWRAQGDELARQGLRVLAIADRRGGPADQLYHDLTLLGLVGIADPPRADAADALLACQRAGIRVVMVTGDHPATARTIARQVGLLPEGSESEVVLGDEITGPEALSPRQRKRLLAATVVARASPLQKLRLLALHQGNGEVVAMTGDGVNDAPALARADVGIAMGERGTDVAREAADVVLRTDAFTAIVEAIRQGRVIVQNLRVFIVYLLSCNLSEVGVVTVALLLGAPLPLLPLQILFLNLVTDVFPALALGLGEGDPSTLVRPPRRARAPLLGPRQWRTISAYAALLTAAALIAQWLTLHGPRPETASTITFLTLALGQLWHVFNMRSVDSGILRNPVTRNRLVWAALALCVGLVLLALGIPAVARILALRQPGWQGWLTVLGFSLVAVLVGQAGIQLRGRRSRRVVASGEGRAMGDGAGMRPA